MKKSRELVVWILASLITASSSAIAGDIIFNDEAITWFAVLIFGIAMIQGSYRIIAKVPKKMAVRIFNGIIMALAGALIGVTHILPWGVYVVIAAVCIFIMVVFLWGYTGHNKETKN